MSNRDAGGLLPQPGGIEGDLIHNLRSALEHAAWLIALRTNPPEDDAERQGHLITDVETQ